MRIHINKDGLFCAVTIMFVFATIIVDIFRKLGSGEGIESIRNIIYIFCFLFVIYHIYTERRTKLDIIFFLFFFPLQAFITLLITPEIAPIFSFFILYYFSRDFVGYYLFSRLDDIEILKKNKWLMLVVALSYSIMVMLQGFRTDSYMLSSYNLIIPTCILLLYGMKEFRFIYLLGGGISCLTILLYGARGALFCVGIGVLFYLVRSILKGRVTVKQVIIIACISVGLIFVMINFYAILGKIYEVTGSRTVKLILTGNIVSSYGRAEMYSAFRAEIKEAPLKYRGILADRVLAARMMNQTISRGTYAHNIVYEILYEYGVVLGVPILLFIFYCVGTCIYKVIKKQNDDLYILLVSIFPAGFCSLFFSGSYLNTHYFWMLLGLTYNVLKGNFSKV
ncbi:MAG: hypothetical protein HDR06_13735 [Lachnospiraceae bacterium]|nr:hypothetical protein [Lachnospiraceae bacterium]